MTDEYVEQRDASYFVRGSRVSLDSVVYGFLNGDSAETIQGNFPALNLEQVYGAITYYLHHQAEIDAYLKARQEGFEEARRSQTHLPSDLRARIGEAREQLARRR